MTTQPPDFIPPTPPPPASRRGGKRPGAGAKQGNLNALKHGRFSRFKQQLPATPLAPTAVAGRVLAAEQRRVSRIAESLLRVVMDAQHQRDVAEAVAKGLPLPPPPLVSGTDQDPRKVVQFMASLSARAEVERAHAAGTLRPTNPALQHARAFATTIERVLPALSAALDRAARPALSPATLGGLLALPARDQQNDQPTPNLQLPSPKLPHKINRKTNDQTAGEPQTKHAPAPPDSTQSSVPARQG